VPACFSWQNATSTFHDKSWKYSIQASGVFLLTPESAQSVARRSVQLGADITNAR